MTSPAGSALVAATQPIPPSEAGSEPASPVACPHCAAGHWRFRGAHYRVSERGEEKVGPCTAPEAVAATDETWLYRFRDKIRASRERVDASRTAAILCSLPRPMETRDVPKPHSEATEREPGSDDD